MQLYIHDPVASISQPVRRLRGFERVTLAPGEKQTVTFTLDRSDFGFYDNRGKFVVEPGEIDVYAGDSSTADLKQSFTDPRLIQAARARVAGALGRRQRERQCASRRAGRSSRDLSSSLANTRVR